VYRWVCSPRGNKNCDVSVHPSQQYAHLQCDQFNYDFLQCLSSNSFKLRPSCCIIQRHPEARKYSKVTNKWSGLRREGLLIYGVSIYLLALNLNSSAG